MIHFFQLSIPSLCPHQLQNDFLIFKVTKFSWIFTSSVHHTFSVSIIELTESEQKTISLRDFPKNPQNNQTKTGEKYSFPVL